MNKTIYMCYKHINPLRKYSLNWKLLNPEWNIELYDNKRCIDFLSAEFSPIFVDIFNFIKDGPIKADFWRVCIIYKYGGLYVDADIEPLKPLDFYLEPDDFFVTCTSFVSHALCNPHFLFAYKNNIILKEAIDIYLQYYKNKKYSYWGWSIVNIFTEIQLLRKIVNFKKFDQIKYVDNKKYKILVEKNGDCCTYKGNTILNNRYKSYRNHNFINNNQIHIGSSSYNIKNIKLNDNYHPNTIISFDNLNPDKFYYLINGNQLKIIRIDQNTGWGQDLVGKFLFITLGPSDTNEKQFGLETIYHPNSIISCYHNYRDTFKFKLNKDILTVFRTDNNEENSYPGWKQNLKVYINHIIIGDSTENTKIIQLNDDFPDEQEIFFVNSNHLFDYKIENKFLIVTRIDKNYGWTDKLAGVIYQIPIGPSNSNQKIVKLKKKYPSDTKLNFSHNYDDEYKYQFKNFELIINRIDINSGWNQNLIAYI